jgi:hypothetical protein
MRIDVNGVFYHLVSSNLSPLPAGSECTGTSVMFVTPDGFLSSNSNFGGGQGRIMLSGINATSISVSTNDGAGIAVSNPFNCLDVVPLKLESFSGMNNNCQTSLNWESEVEQNVKSIEIQRSQDAISFIKVGTVPPKGSNSSYSFVFADTTNGYFRLKITDFDGHYEYSNILSVKSNCNTSYKVFPNPTTSSIEVIGLKNDDEILILDMLGRIVLTFNPLPINNNIDVHKLPSGIYVLKVINNNMIKSNIRIIKD